MNIPSKRIRFYSWYTKAFIEKYFRFILLSFVISFIGIFFILSIYPFVNAFFFQKKEVVGISGPYTSQNLPGEITTLISNPLVSVTPTGEIIPILADSWELLPGEKTYRFHLKKNVYWDDKKEFKARDIKFDYKGVTTKVIDDYTIEFQLDQKLYIFPVYLTKPMLRKPLHGIGGSYSVQNYKVQRDRLTYLTLFPKKKTLPLRIYRFYKTDEDLINAYKRGEITKFSTSDPSVATSFNLWQNTKVQKTIDQSRIMTLFINNDSKVLGNRDARKAIAHATPMMKEYGIPASGPIPPASWAHFTDVKQYPYSLDIARELVEKVKTGSSSASISLYTFSEYSDVAERLKESYDKAGFTTDLKLRSYIPDEFDLLLTIWDVPDDPDQYVYWHSTQTDTNITKYNSLKADKLLEDGRSVVNVQQRKKIYREFQKVIADDIPAFFMYYPYVYTVERK